MQRLVFSLAVTGALLAQFPPLTISPSGNNQKASVTQYIGPVKVTIDYSGPAVHGPDGKDRRGQIWGKLVPHGMTNQVFGTAKLSPWRAGANENTVFEVSHDVTIDGKPLAAGKYGLHMITGVEEWTLIFSKNAEQWGSFFYDEADDALRVTVKPRKHEYLEYLTYAFPVRKPAEAVAEMQWEDLAVGWTVKVADVNPIYLTRLRQNLSGANGFNYQAYMTGAQWCVQNNVGLEDALRWSDLALNKPFSGKKEFQTFSTKALVLTKLGRDAEAAALMKEALAHPATTATDIHQYGRQLQLAKKNEEAYEAFRLNAKRNGDAWPTHVGLARAYSGEGDLKAALEHARAALKQAPDDLNRRSLEGMIKGLESGKAIGQ